jgi:hypothetical protein
MESPTLHRRESSECPENDYASSMAAEASCELLLIVEPDYLQADGAREGQPCGRDK